MNDAEEPKEFFDALARVRELYSEADYLDFANALGSQRATSIELVKDVLGCAGAQYVMMRKGHETELSKKELLRKMDKVASAARRLDHALAEVAEEPRLSNSFEAATKDKLTKGSKPSKKIGTLESYLNDRPIAGLQAIAKFVNKTSLSIGPADISDPLGSRTQALRFWADFVVLFWIDQTEKYPTAGHYYKELGDFKSIAVNAMTTAINRLDKSVSSRTVVTALSSHKTDLFSGNRFDGAAGIFIGSIFFSLLLKSRKNHSSLEELAGFLGMPVEFANGIVEGIDSDHLLAEENFPKKF